MHISPFVAGLPKVELHLHIEGTLEPELKFALAERNGIALAHDTVDQVRASYDFDDLSSFLDSYYDGMNVLRTAEDFHDLAMAYLTRAASQNVRYAEMFFDPQAHTCRGIPFDVVIQGLRRAQLEAEQNLGVRSGLIMCFLRDFQPEYAMATLLESLPYRAWILGVGLDSDETGNPPGAFAEVFARARQEGYLLTMHCDVDIAGSIEHIRQVVEDIGAARIDHGTNVVENPALVQTLVDRGIGLTSCPISNTWISEGSKIDVVKDLVGRGVKVCINSDDPAYFGGYIAENLQLVADEGGVDEAFLALLCRNAVDISWAPLDLKAQLRAEIDEYLAGAR
ncbi:MAG: adenosine deaminase [Propionibacteriaceae bacterium]|uniref:Adenine deaminase n=1 Tax=Propionibacterium ruminifibrarum TaxID=1962131 RepID=A0A375I3F9_9ACTN|nr:adenosine deaminase [Propionibacterium ruminifibrarum]MBE6476611.1 adenosine deaminase [Propionibacteriaceae bacterium]SPF67830.1 adenine deaminase [Propionibacterium ruminifibrarum]